MLDQITNQWGSTYSQLSMAQLSARFACVVIVALFILLIYRLTYSGVAFSKSFSVTVVMTTVVTASIMMIINANLALSLGMVGALSIIRFRSAIKDPRDVGFLFWAVAGGLASGTGLYTIAIFLSVVMGVILIAFRFFPGESNTYMLILRGEAGDIVSAEPVLNGALVRKYKAKVKNVTPGGAEYIYEVKLNKNSEDKFIGELQIAAPDCVVNLVAKTGDTTI